MSGIAIAFQKRGWRVTGSDVGFFPPVSTELEKHGVEFYPGWHPNKMAKYGVPDLVVVGNVASSGNPEWLYVQEHGIAYTSYPEVIAEYFVRKNSIVCAGTYGKTSTATLLSWILANAGYNPSYMFGGLVARNDFDSAHIGDADWSIFEGDEYKTSRWDPKPKFSHYSPTHLLLTGISWDHADIYPTDQAYTETFRELVKSLGLGSMLVACTDNQKVKALTPNFHGSSLVTYGEETDAEYCYTHIKQTKDGLSFDIQSNDQIFHIESNLFGHYQAANVTGCFSMARTIGIEPDIIIDAIKQFPGMKRRLEKRLDGSVTVFDDIAHSPAKAKATLETLRKVYDKKIIAVFEPNTGNRERKTLPGYEHAFDAADELVIPRLTKIKQDRSDLVLPMSGEELAKELHHSHQDVRYIEEDRSLIEHLRTTARPGDVVVFLGSHGFRGMIELLTQQLEP